MRSRPPIVRRFLVATLAALLLTGGLVLEATLQRETARARNSLSATLARALRGASTSANGDPRADALLDQARRHASAGRHNQASRALSEQAAWRPTPDTHELAAKGAAAAGSFTESARHAAFASRLSPGDSSVASRSETALDLAVLARVRTPLRWLAAAGGAWLALALLHRGRRRRQAARRRAYVGALDVVLTSSVDGERPRVEAGGIRLGRHTADLVFDLFLSPRGPRRVRAPRPGPTLALVLSHAASNTSLRLRPRFDVREDAVRISVRERTLGEVLRRSGTWRVYARLDDRLVADTQLHVEGVRCPQPIGAAARFG